MPHNRGSRPRNKIGRGSKFGHPCSSWFCEFGAILGKLFQTVLIFQNTVINCMMSRRSNREIFRDAKREHGLNKSPLSSYGVEKPDRTGINDPPAVCRWCCRCETTERFKVCQRCVQLHIADATLPYYCSKKCQKLHWKTHRVEHLQIEKLLSSFIGESCDSEDSSIPWQARKVNGRWEIGVECPCHAAHGCHKHTSECSSDEC